jgi:predicted transglutaminase-like cysteine proteinase
LEFQGWASIEGAPLSSKWVRVQRERIDSVKGLKTPKDVIVWVRRNVSYQRDSEDYWQSPAETLNRKAGDCEDFAILARALLIGAGFDSSDMWLLIGRDLIAREEHAVLVFKEFILDCRTDKVLKLSQYTDFAPIVAYSDDRAVIFGRKI